MKILIPLLVTCGTVAALLLGLRGATAQTPQAGATSAPATQAVGEVKGVVELFTSQGCSSCPPADALFGKLAKRNDILALTMPVDYWDYLGWKDTLASPANTARQKGYAHARGDGAVYTPQAVINGQAHVNGASEGQIEAALRKTATGRVALSGRLEPDALVVDAGPATTSTHAKGTLLLAHVKRQAEVAIGRGENSGRKVTYANVVTKLAPIGEWGGKASTVRLPRAQVSTDGSDFLAVLLQEGVSGPILAGAEVRVK